VRAKTSRHRSAPAVHDLAGASVVTMKVRTVIPGSRNAAISDCTDCGALKKVLL
jgi:hypothetical protein